MAFTPPNYLLPYQSGNFNQAQGAYQNAQQYAMPSAASRDTAAARVRNRLSGQTQANVQRQNDMYSQRGMTNSGARDRAIRDTYAAGDQALASGLTDLELGFSAQEQEGANILGNLAQGMTQNEAARNQAMQQRNELLSNYDLEAGRQRIEQQLGLGRLSNDLYGIDSNTALGQQGNQIDLIQALGLYGLVQPNNHPWGDQFNDLFHGLLSNAGQNTPRPLPTRNVQLSQLLNKRQPTYY